MTNLKDEYTAAEDINDVRQLLKLVKARPAVKKSGERGTLIAYSELTMMEKRLNHAIEMLVKITDEKIVKRFEGGVDKNDNFVRPLGVSPVLSQSERNEIRKEWSDMETEMRRSQAGKWTRLRGFYVLQLGSADYVVGKDGELFSVNSDAGDGELPFGIRWTVTREDMTHKSYGTKSDAVAVAEFRRVGLLETA